MRRALPILGTNISRTTSTPLVNRLQKQRLVREILTVLQSRADQNKWETDICNQHLEKVLRKVYPGKKDRLQNKRGK